MTKPPKRQNQRHDTSYNANPPDESKWWMFYQNDRIAGFTGWVALLTAVVGIAAVLQLTEFIISEGSYLSITDIKLDSVFIESGHQLTSLINIKNSGKMTAIPDAVAIIPTIVRQKPFLLPSVPNYRGTAEIRFPPIPSGDFPIDMVLFPKSGMTQPDVDAINSGNAAFYIFGFVTYFDRTWRLWDSIYRFCYFYDLSRRSDPRFGMFTICNQSEYL